MPGGIKLCSPGTFLVANYLIINNGSCQVNFTKPNSATIRCTNSQWLPEDATEASVGRAAVAKGRWMTVSPRRNATGVPVGMVLVPKTCRKTPSARPSFPVFLPASFPVLLPVLFPMLRPALPPRPAHPPARLCFLARRTTVGPVTLSIS